MRAALIALLTLLFALPATAGESAVDIVTTSEAKGYSGNSVQTYHIATQTKSGPKEMTLELKTRVIDGLEATHAAFVLPEAMVGSVFLSVEQAGAPTKRWLYMSAGGNLTEIQSSSRSSSFMGTEFFHEDLELGDPSGGTHELLGEETITVGGQSVACYHLKSTPNADIVTAYGLIETWIEKGTYAPRQVLLYDKDGTTKYKKLTMEAVALENGAVLPTKMLMENLKKGTSTRIEVKEYRLDVPADELPESLYDPDQLGK